MSKLTPGAIIKTIVASLLLFIFVYLLYGPSFREYLAFRKKSSTFEKMLKIVNALDTRVSQNILPLNLSDPFFSPYNKKDPFTGKDFGYFVKGNCWYLISAGPDNMIDYQNNSQDLLTYDPTNGVFSAGDLIFSSEITPRMTGDQKRGKAGAK